MTHRTVRFGVGLAAAAALALGAGLVTPAAAHPVSPHLNPKVAPGGNFDLSGWELQLPTGSTNNTTTIPPSQLEGPTGYTSKYFYTDQTDGSMTFWDPENGVTLGSRFPRTELREINSSGGLAEWNPATGTHTLSATVASSKIPNHVCVGQIHDDNSQPGSKPLAELYYYSNGQIKLGVETSPAGGNEPQTTVTTVSLGKQWSYVLSITGGNTINLTVTSGSSSKTMHWPIPSSFHGILMYFKAGDYDQSTGSSSTVGALVHFYALGVQHTA
ncbi:MAG TPA: polysaccharide lyase family 7 protein [Pseudonocardiaceae bacterium]|jgi:hypothetical protein